MGTFKKELESLLNSYSKENGSNTPDFILAKYLVGCLNAYNKALVERDRWFEVKVWKMDKPDDLTDPTAVVNR